jgi:peptidyl-prolyl cis-trans isomerase C
MPLYVNHAEIADEKVFAEMQYHPASSIEEAQEKAARALAIRELLLQESARLEIIAPDETVTQEVREDFLISRLLEQEVMISEPDEVSCQRYYEQNRKTFRDTQSNPVLFEYVRSTIAAYLKEATWQMAVKQYLNSLVAKARIEGISLGGSDNDPPVA